MPYYTYQCPECPTTHEVERSIHAEELDEYCKCGAKMTRVFNPPGIAFKGGGFYSTGG